MEKFFSKRRFFLFFLGFGALISFLLGLISRNSFINIFIKSILSGLLIGAFGFGLDMFLISILGEEEYDKLFISNQKTEEKNTSKSIDIKEELTEDNDITYDEILKTEEKELSQEDRGSQFSFSTFEKPEPESLMPVMEEKIPPEELRTEEKDKETSTKKSYNYDGEVSFQVKNKKISTTPEVVAKAIKTILQRDGD